MQTKNFNEISQRFSKSSNFPPDIYKDLSKPQRILFFNGVRNIRYYHVRFYNNEQNEPVAHVLYNLKRSPKEKIISLKEKV